uniref:N(G),N(G)-dimethylarginine dimethylaminohydrolase 1 n=1 Tax=Aceria tosichella TaxID=561515 RepID=A0A6G1SKM2_9ACAR
MPAHFGKYNYAICRRLSRGSALSRDQANHSLTIDDETLANNNGTTTSDGKTTKGKKNKNKSKKDAKKNNGNSETEPASSYEPIDFDSANEELNNYIATLRMLNVDVIELCPDESLKYESVFVGDVAVTVNGLALLCRPRDRLDEINEVKQIIKVELNLPIIEINDETALLNGGDVLWTGREIFVGLSNETNESGARAVAAAFPEFSVTPVKVPPKDNLRLKSYITMAGPDILCINRSQEAQSILRRMEREASYNYKLITVDDDKASNVLYLNGTLIHRNDLPNSVSVLQDKIDYSRVPVKISELCKNNPYHGLDSLCLLVRKSHRIQTIV